MQEQVNNLKNMLERVKALTAQSYMIIEHTSDVLALNSKNIAGILTDIEKQLEQISDYSAP